jgi:circadian clock protein KaiC
VTSASKLALARQTTGAPPFDAILGGGIPAGSVVVVAGEPGSGKTVLVLQMLFAAAREGKRSLYFTTLSEPAAKLIRFMQRFDFFDADLLHDRIALTDLGDAIRAGAGTVIDVLQAKIDEVEPAFVVIDSYRALLELLENDASPRAFTYDLACQTAAWGATTVLVGEYARAEVAQRPEFAIADGIIFLGSEREELTSVRGLEVLKMRGLGYSSGRHFFDISEEGLIVYPRVSAPFASERQAGIDLDERAGTGIAGLDDAVGGGWPRHSTTVVQGATGTGKTLLALQFLVAGVAAGEPGVLFSLEETPGQLRTVARSIGLDLEAAEAAGLLSIIYTSPVELSTDRFLREAGEAVRAVGARRAVFDSLTTMGLGVPSTRRFKELVYAIAKQLGSERVTALMTVEAPELVGPGSVSVDGVSFIADNVVQLRYVASDRGRARSVTVVKARGLDHASDARALVIGRDGLRVLGHGTGDPGSVPTAATLQPVGPR